MGTHKVVVREHYDLVCTHKMKLVGAHKPSLCVLAAVKNISTSVSTHKILMLIHNTAVCGHKPL